MLELNLTVIVPTTPRYSNQMARPKIVLKRSNIPEPSGVALDMQWPSVAVAAADDRDGGTRIRGMSEVYSL